jgi:hypothetical protein
VCNLVLCILFVLYLALLPQFTDILSGSELSNGDEDEDAYEDEGVYEDDD